MNLLLSFILLAVLWLDSEPAFATAPGHIPVAQNGIIHLEDWDQGTIPLKGEWEFYWNQLLDPSFFSPFSPDNAPFSPAYYPVPDIWRKELDQKVSNEGFATYRLTILLGKKPSRSMALYVPSIATAYRLWVNGELLASNGKVGTSRAEMVPKNVPKVVPIPSRSERIELIIQVSNYVQRKGGLWQPVTFGYAEDILLMREKRLFAEIFLVGSLLTMGIYHVSAFVTLRRDKSALYFGLVCLLISLRTMALGETLLVRFIPSFPWELAVKIEYLTALFTIAFFTLYVYELFPEKMSRRFPHLSLAIASIFGFIVLTAPARIYTQLMMTIQIWFIVGMVYILYIFFLAAVRKKTGSYLHAAAIMIFFLSILNDILYYNHVIRTGDLSALGLFIFLFAQAFVLLRKFSSAFDRAETLSRDLTVLNQTLENKVVERTTALRESNVCLEQAHQELSRLEKARRDLLSNISHDLKTPLASIQGYIKAMLDGIIPSSDRKYLQMIYNKSLYINRLFDDLLELSKLESGQVRFVKEKKPVSPFFRQLYQKYELDILEKELMAEYEDQTLVPEGYAVYVYIDPVRIEQVFANYISNAIRYTPHGTIKVAVHAAPDNDAAASYQVTVSVADTGIGIGDEALPNVFNRFFRGHSASTGNADGTGLGLAICKGIIEQHGGKVGATSNLGKGSTFTFTIPASLLPAENLHDAEER